MSVTRWGLPGQGRTEPQPWRWVDMGIVVLDFIEGTIINAGRTVGMAGFFLRAHANHLRDTEEFAGSVSTGIENLLVTAQDPVRDDNEDGDDDGHVCNH